MIDFGYVSGAAIRHGIRMHETEGAYTWHCRGLTGDTTYPSARAAVHAAMETLNLTLYSVDVWKCLPGADEYGGETFDRQLYLMCSTDADSYKEARKFLTKYEFVGVITIVTDLDWRETCLK